MQYTFDHAAAQQTIDEMARISHNFDTLLNDMDGQLQSCLADWAQGTREEYEQAKRRWYGYAQQVHQSLIVAQNKLNEIEGRYRQAQHKSASMWA